MAPAPPFSGVPLWRGYLRRLARRGALVGWKGRMAHLAVISQTDEREQQDTTMGQITVFKIRHTEHSLFHETRNETENSILTN